MVIARRRPQTRSQTGVRQFRHNRDFLRRQGLERRNILLVPRIRRRVRFYTPGEVAPYIEMFVVNGQPRSGLHPGTHYRHAIHIAYTGGRQGDFALANAIAGLARTPAGYVWHHFHDWRPSPAGGGNGSGTLYLMSVAEHNVYHCGGVLQMESSLGVPYRP